MLPTITPRRNFWANLLTFWIPVKTHRKYARGVVQMGFFEFLRRRRAERTATFDYDLSIVAIMKDEGPYLKEWIDFHILVGVGHFYLYDNGSTDNTQKILAPYVARGLVDFIDFPGEKMQNNAYTDAVNRFARQTRWMAVIDLDEFIVPVENETVVEFLHTLPRNFGALVMSWVMYGSSGHVKKPRGLVIENYKWRGHNPRKTGCKSIINPRFIVRQTNPHINEFAGFLVDENGHKLGRINQTTNPPSFNKIRCNHYVTKSYDEYKARCNRGSVASGIATSRKKWTPERWALFDINDVYDDTMDKYVPLLKKKTKPAK